MLLLREMRLFYYLFNTAKLKNKVLKMEQKTRDLNDMAIFEEIVSAGGITAAADRVSLPKSNVSRRLTRLESRLGIQIIERNSRTSRLTSVGKRYATFTGRFWRKRKPQTTSSPRVLTFQREK